MPIEQTPDGKWILHPNGIEFSEDDPVNHPSHYTDGSIEVIDFIEDKNLPFHLGNAVKYINRYIMLKGGSDEN